MIKKIEIAGRVKLILVIDGFIDRKLLAEFWRAVFAEADRIFAEAIKVKRAEKTSKRIRLGRIYLGIVEDITGCSISENINAYEITYHHIDGKEYKIAKIESVDKLKHELIKTVPIQAGIHNTITALVKAGKIAADNLKRDIIKGQLFHI